MAFYTFIYYLRKLILNFLFTIIPHKVVFKNFAYFLGTVILRRNSLLVRTISIACMIPFQRLIVLNLILTGIVVGRSLGKNSSFYKSREVINEGFTY